MPTSAEKKRYTATVVRDLKTGVHYTRISDKGPQTGGKHVKVIEILNGEDKDELRKRAEKFIGSLKK